MPALQANSQAIPNLSENLLQAAEYGDLEKVKQLLAAGVNPNFQDEYGDTGVKSLKVK